MAQIHVALSDDLGEWATARAAERHLADANEYVADLLRRDREEAEQLARLQAGIDEGLTSGISDRDPLEYLSGLRAGLIV
jgi:antitoxin ParD1/3/4